MDFKVKEDPDGVIPRILKTCAEQLCGILQHIVNLGPSQGKVPVPYQNFMHLRLVTTDQMP